MNYNNHSCLAQNRDKNFIVRGIWIWGLGSVAIYTRLFISLSLSLSLCGTKLGILSKLEGIRLGSCCYR